MQAVRSTATVTAAADHSLDGRQAYRHIHKTGMGDSDSDLIEPFEAIVSGAARAALDMRAGLIVVLTTTGQSAYLLARYRLALPILVLSQSEEVGCLCCLVHYCLLTNLMMMQPCEFIVRVKEVLALTIASVLHFLSCQAAASKLNNPASMCSTAKLASVFATRQR